MALEPESEHDAILREANAIAIMGPNGNAALDSVKESVSEAAIASAGS